MLAVILDFNFLVKLFYSDWLNKLSRKLLLLWYKNIIYSFK